MPIRNNISDFIRRYKETRHLSIVELSEELGITKNSAIGYLHGTVNPRADTIDTMAERCGVSPEEMISAHPLGWERAELVEQAARQFSVLPPEQRDRAVSLFLTLVDLLAEGDQS